MAEYPRMLFGQNGATLVVPDAAAHQAAGSDWDTKPNDSHYAPKAPPLVVQSHQEPLVEAIARRVLELLSEALPALLAKPAPAARKIKE